MKPVRLEVAARIEINEAADFYERRRTGLGRRWRLDAAVALRKVERNPRVGRPAGEGARKLRIAAFPYHLIFIERAEDILIIAFAHDRRSPNYWRERL